MNNKNENWVVTDASCNQRYKKLDSHKFLFQEDRVINPVTKETELFEAEINLTDYMPENLYNTCASFGYERKDVFKWIQEDKNLALIAECLFEFEV